MTQIWNLYWVTTPDHDEDWFVISKSSKEAAEFHEQSEGYDSPDYAHAEFIMEVPNTAVNIWQAGLNSPDNAYVSYWPCNKTLRACGAEITEPEKGARVVRLAGRTFGEGLLESEVLKLDALKEK